MKRRKVFFWILFAAITLFIFSNSAKPAARSSAQSGVFSGLLLKYFGAFFKNEDTAVLLVRKAAHFTEFFAQAAAESAALFTDAYRKRAVYVLFTGLLTACTDELIQMFFEGRASMVTDVFIDFSGTCLAVVCFAVFSCVFLNRSKGKG